jgi:hypothetical protein
MAQQTIETTDTVGTAIVTKTNANFDELYLTKTEVEAARGDEDDLDTRLGGFDTSIASLSSGSGVVVSDGDTAGFLADKLVSSDSSIDIAVVNPGADETLSVTVSLATLHANALSF